MNWDIFYLALVIIIIGLAVFIELGTISLRLKRILEHLLKENP